MKNIYIILTAIILAVALLTVFSKAMSSPLSKEEVKESIQNKIDKTVEKSNIKNIVLIISSEKTGFSESFIAGEEINSNINAPYHVASIGKTITATIVNMLVDEGKLNLSDKIIHYLDYSILKGLFVFEDIDYKDEVTIQSLMDHTSGIGDYFEDSVREGMTIKELMIEDPNRLWSPIELVDFTRNNQSAISMPHTSFHYSDTGYILLGLIIESITEQNYHDVLHEKIFTSLGMNDSYMMFLSEPKNDKKDILPILFDGVDISKSNVLSIDWTGGGIITTNNDLLKFYQALNDGELISEKLLMNMKSFNNKLISGIHHGSGMAEIRFKEFFFLLGNMDNIYGGIGANGSFMLFNPVTETYIIANFGSLDLMEKSVQTLITILQIYDRLEL